MKIGVMLRHHKRQPGGIGTYTTNLLKHLLSIDRDNQYLLMCSHPSQLGSGDGHPNVREVVVRSRTKLGWDQIAVPMAARRHELDLVFNPKLSVPLFTKSKTVFVLHGADWFVFPKNYPFPDRLYHKLSAPIYAKRADAIVSVSNDATTQIVGTLRLDSGKIATIYHGVNGSFKVVENANRLEEVRNRYGLPEHFLLYLGQIYPMKNVGSIIRAFGNIRGKIPHKLVIVGEPGPRSREDLDAIAECGLENDVMVLGWVPGEDVPLLYNLADLFVFPSLYEGFGIPLLEAMACGCPVVTSDRGAPKEVAGDAAVLVDPESLDSISAGILAVLENPQQREALIAQGLRRVEAFSWQASARETLALFEKVMAAKASGVSRRLRSGRRGRDVPDLVSANR